MIQNLSETQFHYIIKFVLTQQLLKSPHLLMESGSVVDTGRFTELKPVTTLFLLKASRGQQSAAAE